ncbi:transposase [uncultured Massilia sp.]|uniref:transposase n=1 Tax=uncultured Massilia sp. TaxID=169973 RepID=UPI0025E9E07B|nr:transposase [uncultured Massilia sp.]
MPRPTRTVMPDVPLHIIQRGNNRIPCFGHPSDYLVYLDVLRECAQDCDCAVHAYVLMTNHVHLLMSPGDTDGPSRLMQRLGQRYVQYFNRRHARTGTLWEGRFRSCLVMDAHYLMACHRYIELNPVRAGMVATPSDYPWSSYRINALGDDSDIITPHPVYSDMAADPPARQATYRKFFEQDLAADMLEQIRYASNSSRPLGTAPPHQPALILGRPLT